MNLFPTIPGLHALLVAGLVLLTPASVSLALDFDFKDPKGVNSTQFLLDSELEPIMGVADGISGTVSFDPKKPKSLTGKIVIDAKSVRTTNSRMTRKLHTDEWLDVEKHGQVTFEVEKVLQAAPDSKSGQLRLRLKGTFTLKGVSKPLTVEATVKHLPGKLGDRMRGANGDLLVVRSTFEIKRSDFGLGAPMAVVADTLEIRVAIVGMHANK